MASALHPQTRRYDHRHAAIELGMEPPIQAVGRRHANFDRRRVSLRWLCGTVLTGVCGCGLIGAAIYAALDRDAIVATRPEYAVPTAVDTSDNADALHKGDRLIRAANIVAEKQSFRAPVTITVGDKQTIRTKAFTHVSTTLTLASTGLADQVPDFNPLKLLATDDQDTPDTPVDPGPALDDSEASFTTSDLSQAAPSDFAGVLTLDDVEAQISAFVKARSSDTLPTLPPQFYLMRTRVAVPSLPLNALSYAAPGGALTTPFAFNNVKVVPENVSIVQQSARTRDDAGLERLVILHHGETLDDILRANGAASDQIRAIKIAFGARKGEAPVADGRRLRILLASIDGKTAPQIARISVYADETLETTVALEDSGGYVQVSRVDPSPKLVRAPRKSDEGDENDSDAGMRLYRSLYETALKQAIPKPVIDDLVKVFSNDVDFQQAVSAGDTLDAFYSDEDAESHNELLYASITIRDETFKYYRFQAPDDGSVDFYDPNGRSTRKVLIRKPVPTGELTSGFGLRFHPILGYSRPHTGVDWAAPIGTPILAAGSGTVLTAERNASYGNHVEIQHANGYITTYSHMSGFARGLTNGSHVRQGQVVGYLGQTGLATGPHLHYEVIVNGHFVDPMRVKLARTRDMDSKMLASFRREHDRIDALMASAPNSAQDAGQHAAN